MGGRGDQAAGNDPVVEDLAPPVHVGQERLERLHPLDDPRRQDRPLRLGDDPRHQVERERALLPGQLEGDAPIPEAAVPGRAPRTRTRRSPAPAASRGGCGPPVGERPADSNISSHALTPRMSAGV